MIPPTGSHPPGSFTKNFGWHGKGLLSLHNAIRRGFGSKLERVTRADWRVACGLDTNRFLLAANFFLFNVVRGGGNTIPVDEFVRQAVMEPHSAAFDRLGLFVLNLSLGGKRAGANSGVEFPAPWANEFVKQALWQAGRWRRSALGEAAMDGFLTSRISGVSDAKQKCRSNYRHLYELTKYLPSASSRINSEAESWMAAALFTAWDRRALAGAAIAPRAAALVSTSEVAEDYKLLGLDRDEFQTTALPIAEQYVAAGGLVRFSGVSAPALPGGKSPSSPKGRARSRATKPGGPPSPAIAPSAADLHWLVAAGSEAAVEREISQRLALKRNQVLAAKLKALYGHKCMACGQALVIGLDPDRRYAEAAHIKPVGKPHNGPDKIGNMLVLCANHHLQFDRGILSLRSTPSGTNFISRIPGDPVHGTAVLLHRKHALDADCLKWHRANFAGVGR